MSQTQHRIRGVIFFCCRFLANLHQFACLMDAGDKHLRGAMKKENANGKDEEDMWVEVGNCFGVAADDTRFYELLFRAVWKEGTIPVFWQRDHSDNVEAAGKREDEKSADGDEESGDERMDEDEDEATDSKERDEDVDEESAEKRDAFLREMRVHMVGFMMNVEKIRWMLERGKLAKSEGKKENTYGKIRQLKKTLAGTTSPDQSMKEVADAFKHAVDDLRQVVKQFLVASKSSRRQKSAEPKLTLCHCLRCVRACVCFTIGCVCFARAVVTEPPMEMRSLKFPLSPMDCLHTTNEHGLRGLLVLYRIFFMMAAAYHVVANGGMCLEGTAEQRERQWFEFDGCQTLHDKNLCLFRICQLL